MSGQLNFLIEVCSFWSISIELVLIIIELSLSISPFFELFLANSLFPLDFYSTNVFFGNIQVF